MPPSLLFPSATAVRGAAFILYKRDVAAATRENSVVPAEVADELEVPPEARVVQHAPGVAADRKNPPGFDVVMPVEDKAMRMIGDRAAIDHCLPVIFASGFQTIQFEQPIGGRVETQITHTWCQLRIGYLQRTAFDQPWAGKAMSLRQTDKVVPVQRSTQAFAVQHGIVAYSVRHPAVGIDIRKIEFATRLEQAMHFTQHRILIRREIDHAVRHDDIEAAAFQPEFIEFLDIALLEYDVVKTKFFDVIGAITFRNRKLFFGHIHTDHLPTRTCQLRQRIDIPTGAAAQVQDPAAFQQWRANQTAAVVARPHFRVNVR